jgi:hypothetical protein
VPLVREITFENAEVSLFFLHQTCCVIWKKEKKLRRIDLFVFVYINCMASFLYFSNFYESTHMI